MSTPTLTRALVALALFPLAAGCGPETPPDTWGAVPRRVEFELPVPLERARGTEHTVALEARAALAPALDLVDSLTRDRDHDRTQEGLVWRSSPGLSDAVEWRFVLKNVHDAWSAPGHIGGPVKPAQSWRFRLEVKPKMRGDDAFRVVLDGTRETPAGDWRAELGTASLSVDWRAACDAVDRVTCRTFPTTPTSLGDGRASVTARLELELERRLVELEIHEVQPTDDPANPGDRHTVYTAQGSESADGSGTVQTSSRYEFPGRPVRAPHVTRATWLPSGAGIRRYDGDWVDSNGLSGVYRSVQCWGLTGETLYSRSVYEGRPGGDQETGDPAACPGGVEP